MDVLKKMFGKGDDEKKEPAQFKDEFRKPTWFEESETDDELFDSKRKFLQMFTNPLELQKHFDQQMQELLKTIKQYEDGGDFDRNFRDEYMKPGFEENYEEFKKNAKSMDTDLDDEIYADQLHSLLQRLSPDVQSFLPGNKPKLSKPKVKLTDEETILGRIHGTITDGTNQAPLVRRRDKLVQKIPPHFGGIFEGSHQKKKCLQGPKMFGQSIMTQTTRKPDGSYETKRIVRDTDGNIKTTITRSVDGKTETITTHGDGREQEFGKKELFPKAETTSALLASARNIFVSKQGYALPLNLW